MKCSKCGYIPPKGRPKKLDDAKVLKLHKQDWTLAEIAAQFKVTRGAVQASLKRIYRF